MKKNQQKQKYVHAGSYVKKKKGNIMIRNLWEKHIIWTYNLSETFHMDLNLKFS